MTRRWHLVLSGICLCGSRLGNAFQPETGLPRKRHGTNPSFTTGEHRGGMRPSKSPSSSPSISSSSSSSSSLTVFRDQADSDFQSEIPRKAFQTPVTTFTSVVECLDSIEDASPNEFTVLLYFAHYCRMCHQANIPFKKLAYKNPDVKFTRLETSILTSKQLRSLGISRVPFLQIFRNGICVASFSTKWRLESELRETLLLCQHRSLGDWQSFCYQYDDEIQLNKKARERLRAETLRLLPMEEETLVTTLASEGQLLQAIKAAVPTRGSTTSPKPLVVLFHSHFEQACYRAQRQYKRIAEQPLHKEFFSMTRIERSVLSDSTLQDLGIERYPHIQVYKDGNCVASFSIPQTYIFSKMVGDSLDTIRNRTSKAWQDYVQHHRVDMEANKAVQDVLHRRQLLP
jgi:hypothetical protein